MTVFSVFDSVILGLRLGSMLSKVKLRQVMLSYDKLCYVKLCYVKLC